MTKRKVSKPGKENEQQVNSALSISLMMDRRAELLPAGYTISRGFADPIFLPELIQMRLVWEKYFLGWRRVRFGSIYPLRFLVRSL